ncbi:hypothetical protein RBSH_01253 [Rhodopirellula baltica SH28]|uniref:Uncharacterized protein n=1 Tax=Rhodopirellula baltica SH28 TaxID=993517 RepID=K5DKN7_RHOBT|nr:hypothetical protein RBSH_01253 [Rhodopirellula baltica SH28]
MAFPVIESFFSGSWSPRSERLESFWERSICATFPLRMSVRPQQMTMPSVPGLRYFARDRGIQPL